MALSVSAFPEHIQARDAVLDDPATRSLATAPRILGFFGGGVSSGVVSRRPDPHPHPPSAPARLDIGVPSPRPLPLLPHSLSSSPSSPIIVPSRSASGPSKHTSSVPLRHPGRSRNGSLPSTAPPISKVLITHHNPNAPSLSMRYQPLAVDLPSPTPNILAPSAIRPLPRVPPSSVTLGLPSASHSISPARTPFKRPRTSPSSFSGFSGLPTPGFGAAFDSIPSSWASKPSGLSSSRPKSPPSRAILRTAVDHQRPPALKVPRARSLLRTRRERSLDSYARLSSGSAPPTPPATAGTTTLAGGVSRSLTVGRYAYQGLRPLGKRPNVTPTIMGRQQQERRDSLSARDLGPGSAALRVRNPSLRHVRPQCPSGPVVRTRSVRATSDSPPASQIPNVPITVQKADSSGDTDLHIHPFATPFGSNDDPNPPAESPIDSPLEFFVDGPETDANRSPSPMEYALPPESGELSDWHSTNDEETTDDDLGGVSSSTSNSRGFARGRRRRTQLRSYRMDYRPQTQVNNNNNDSDRERSWHHHVTIQDVPKPARALPVPPSAAASSSREKKKGKEENKKWSFGDFTSLSSPSTPGTRTSSPRREGRSRQPRRLAEAVSLAIGNRDATHSRGRVSGPSGVRTSGGGGVDPVEYEVLDIRMPSLEGKKDELQESRSPSPLDFRIPGFSPISGDDDLSDSSVVLKTTTASPAVQDSASRSENVHWVTKEGKQSGLSRDSTASRVVFHSPRVEEDYDDHHRAEDAPPFMWLTRDRPAEKPAAFISLPPPPPARRSVRALSDTLGGGGGGGRDKFPAVVSSISAVGYPPLPPLSTTYLVYPAAKRGGNVDKAAVEMGSRRQQRTTSGPGGGGRNGSSAGAADTTRVGREDEDEEEGEEGEDEDDEDIYCDEEPGQVLEVKAGRVWEESRETHVVDVIPKLRSE